MLALVMSQLQHTWKCRSFSQSHALSNGLNTRHNEEIAGDLHHAGLVRLISHVLQTTDRALNTRCQLWHRICTWNRCAYKQLQSQDEQQPYELLCAWPHIVQLDLSIYRMQCLDRIEKTAKMAEKSSFSSFTPQCKIAFTCH